MKEFEKCLREQLRRHPSMRPQDICKLCYQAAHGGEHLLRDLPAARRYLEEEFASVRADGSAPLYEAISSAYVRVNIAPWKAAGRTAEELFDLFVSGAYAKGDIEPYLRAAAPIWEQSGRGRAELDDFLAQYRTAGCPSLHHSSLYREQERPAYRVIARHLIEDGISNI